MKHLLNLGMSDPLSLGMAHPLSQRLETLTSPKVGRGVSRAVTIGILFGAATLSAPLIQADAHPEKEWKEKLVGKAETNTSKSVIKRMIEVDGKKTSEHFEIIVDGDEVKAFRVEPSGQKTRINIEDMKGEDGAIIIMEDIEGVDVTGTKSQRVLKLGNEGDSFIHAPREGQSKVRSGQITFFNAPNSPNPPLPPGLNKHSKNVFVFEDEAIQELKSLKSFELLQGLESLAGLENLKALSELKGLEGLEGLKGLEALKNLGNIEIHSFAMDNPEHEVKLKLRMMESKLAAARAMLESTEVDADDSREMIKAKRELEKARKALKAAERALRDAE